MSLLTTLLISTLCQVAVPVKAADLTLLTAAVEEQCTAQPTLSVTYRTRTKWTESGKKFNRPPPAEVESTWHRAVDREAALRRYVHDPKLTLSQWYFDGTTTHEWIYKHESDKLDKVTVNRSPPRRSLRFANVFPFLLGWDNRFELPGGMSYFLHAAEQNNTLTARQIGDTIELDLGPHQMAEATWNLALTVDPLHGNRIKSITYRRVAPTQPPGIYHQCVIDEFQLIDDHQAHEKIWFPLHARYLTLFAEEQIDVTAVSYNAVIANTLFESPSIPSGVTIQELPATPGGDIIETIAGGEAGRQQRLEMLNQEAQTESAHLERDGIVFDATPPTSTSFLFNPQTWLGVFVFMFAVLCWKFRRKDC